MIPVNHPEVNSCASSPLIAIAAVSLAACGDGTGPSDTKPSGEYVVTPNGSRTPGAVRLRIISADDDRVILDLLSGDHRTPAFPVRDTAAWNDGFYRAQWQGSEGGVVHVLQLTATRCEGRTILSTFSGLEPYPWSSCALSRP